MTDQTYKITIVSNKTLEEINDGPYAPHANPPVSYGGKTYSGFRLVKTGSYAGGYIGMAEGDEVIFYGIEVQNATPE